MLTFGKKGKPFARVVGGKYDNKVLRIDENNESKPVKNQDPFDLFNESYILSKTRKLSPPKLRKVRSRMLDLDDDFDDLGIEESIMKGLHDEYAEKMKHEVILNDGQFIPTIDKSEDRVIYYLSGPSGSGKSYLTSIIIKEYKKAFPDNKVIVFSRLDNDEVIDMHNPIRIMINDELVEDPIDVAKTFRDALLIFDDIDTLNDKEQREAVYKLMEDVLQIGRHNRIFAIITSHLLMDYKKTRSIINESHYVFVYPNSGSTYHIHRFLKVYAGMGANDIKKFMGLPSRWVGVKKNYPMAVLSQNQAYLLSKK